MHGPGPGKPLGCLSECEEWNEAMHYLFRNEPAEAVADEDEGRVSLLWRLAEPSKSHQQTFACHWQICNRAAKDARRVITKRSNPRYDVGLAKEVRQPISQPDCTVLAGPCGLPVATKTVNRYDAVTY